MADEVYLGEPPEIIKAWMIAHYVPEPNDKLKLVVETTIDYKKSGIYEAQRDDVNKPIVIDWGDGTVEEIDGDVSQKVYEYSSVGTFNVVVDNIKSYAASINNETWYNTTSQNAYTLKEVITMPDNIMSIGNYAFDNCINLTNMMIGSGVMSIENYAFSNCSGLKSMTMPNRLTSIGKSAFYSCNNLTSLIINNNIVTIKSEAFYKCNNLKDLRIDKSVEYVQSMANYSWNLPTGCTITCTNGSIII